MGCVVGEVEKKRFVIFLSDFVDEPDRFVGKRVGHVKIFIRFDGLVSARHFSIVSRLNVIESARQTSVKFVEPTLKRPNIPVVRTQMPFASHQGVVVGGLENLGQRHAVVV